MEFPNKQYQIIYADPPWSYKNKRTGGSMKSGSLSHYKTMTIEEISSLSVPQISDKNSVLFLWVTCPLMKEGLQVMESWGFTYKTKIYWRKIMSLGMGFWFRGQVEELWLGVRGKVKAFRLQEPNFIQCKVQKHSEKPEEFRQLIERAIINMPYRNKIELFARKRIKGWDAWGDEIG